MENYSYQSYPDSGESSPRSREIDFENPPPWDETQQQQQPQNYKAKFMCSYGGKIQPRTHDNQLSYVGGETKILAVDLTTKFTAMMAKLSALCDATPQDNLTFKYQLPGEDLDALISVTNDDDLDHMMHEYDRLYRVSNRPARMRLFLFLSETNSSSAPSSAPPETVKPNNVDFLFGLEKTAGVGVASAVAAPPPQSPPPAVKFRNPVPEPAAPPVEYQARLNLNPTTDRVAVSDPNVLQRQLQQMQIAENEQGAYRRKSEDNYPAGDYYVQKAPEKFPPANFPASAPGYWPEKRSSGEVYPPPVSAASGGGDAPLYMIPAPGTFYHAPVVRPPVTQGYYAVQRMGSDNFRDAPVYGGVPPPKAAVPASLPPAQTVKGPAYSEGFGMFRPGGIPDSTGAPYAQVAYDSGSGRQVYYTAPSGVVHAPPYQGVFPPVTADMRAGGVSLGQDVKGINKVTQGSV